MNQASALVGLPIQARKTSQLYETIFNCALSSNLCNEFALSWRVAKQPIAKLLQSPLSMSSLLAACRHLRVLLVLRLLQNPFGLVVQLEFFRCSWILQQRNALFFSVIAANDDPRYNSGVRVVCADAPRVTN